jgi:hypothetical protein
MSEFKVVIQNNAQRPRIGAGWAIYNFLPERLPVNEQKAEIFILLPNREFSARNCCPIANKKLMKCTSRPGIANALVVRSLLPFRWFWRC